MKVAKVTFFAFLAALIAVGVSTTAYSFHSGGVAECGGCHSMHSPKAGGSSLLVGIDPSSACLTCHQHAGDTTTSSYHISTAEADMPVGTAPLQRTPGGDFGWLKKTYTFTVRGTANTEAGESHGHNIIADDFGYLPGATDCVVSPGGSFSSAQLGCNSCHDPHGKYRRDSNNAISKTGAPIIASGSYKTSTAVGYTEPPTAGTALGVYRLLAGSGYENSTSGPILFPGVPAAKAPNTYNQTEATNQVRVAYGVTEAGGHTTWGRWCGTCHGAMHSSGNYVHPVDQGLGTGLNSIGSVYNSYVKSGDMTGAQTSSFTSLVPFATNSGDYAALATLANNNAATYAGPTDGDQVTCLSCHRAHASPFPEMLRWNMENEFMVKNSIYQTTERGRTATEAAAGYYDRQATPTFASYQRTLCNKCHAKD